MQKTKQRKIGLMASLLAVATFITAIASLGISTAQGTSLTETANVVVPTYCGFTITTPASGNLNFGTINPNANSYTNTIMTFSNVGNADTNVLVSGASTTGYAGWNGVTTSSQGFGITNTLYSTASQSSYTGTALTSSPVTTPLVVLGSGATTNSLYWGLAIPQYQGAQQYNVILTVGSSC